MFPKFNQNPQKVINVNGKDIYIFNNSNNSKNIDYKTVDSFGNEWNKFNGFTSEEIEKIGNEYFDIALDKLSYNLKVLDVGCGMGRWSYFIANKVQCVDAIDPSKAVFAAAQTLKELKNVRISNTDVDNLPYEDNTFDFVFSLGVLHHIPDTLDAMKKCVEKLKPGGYFLVYLYYNLDNRGGMYKFIFKTSNLLRKVISKMPLFLRNIICELLTFFIYLPFISLAYFLKFLGFKGYKKIPLAYYCGKSFKVIRNDVYDRFATPLEQRFSKIEIKQMMEACGLTNIQFSEHMPYWHAIGQKAHQ